MQKHAAGAQREYFNINRPIHSVSTHPIHRRHHLLLQLLHTTLCVNSSICTYKSCINGKAILKKFVEVESEGLREDSFSLNQGPNLF